MQKPLNALEAIEQLYGPLPPDNLQIITTLIHKFARVSYSLSLLKVEVRGHPALNWTLFLAEPINMQSSPVLISSDGCWPHYINDQIVEKIISNGVSFAWFNRVELAHDLDALTRSGKVHDAWPETSWSAISVWAWSFQRNIDALVNYSPHSFTSFNIIGHSRSGKSALVAGALDPRISAVVSNNSGTGGAASLKFSDSNAETLESMINKFPHWVASNKFSTAKINEFISLDLPQIWIRAIAPRGLLILQAKGDSWANPKGTYEMYSQINEYWREKISNLEFVSREGLHPMSEIDWANAIKFIVNIKD